jgi:hypothetical protein
LPHETLQLEIGEGQLEDLSKLQAHCALYDQLVRVDRLITSRPLAFLAIFFVQQIETNLLVPLIVGKGDGPESGVSILFFTLAMGSLFGLAGATLAVPP